MKKNFRKIFYIFFLFIFTEYLIFPQNEKSERTDIFSTKQKNPLLPKEISIFIRAYPDLIFNVAFDQNYNDWAVKITVPERKESKVFYWNNGSMIPEEEIENKEKYWTLLYFYNKVLKDPSEMTEEQRENLKAFSSAGNRKNGAGTPMFFFDFVYDSYDQKTIEKYIVQTTFLGKRTRVHQRILPKLQTVEKKIYEAAQDDEEVQNFVSNIKSTDAYFWRKIAGTNRMSFHSLGIAVDILPVKYKGEMFWSWTKDKNPDEWMLTPLSKRWMPPQKVIEIFEEEGFIWGGKWAIWDNMHFEYHPELLLYSDEQKSSI